MKEKRENREYSLQQVYLLIESQISESVFWKHEWVNISIISIALFTLVIILTGVLISFTSIFCLAIIVLATYKLKRDENMKIKILKKIRENYINNKSKFDKDE